MPILRPECLESLATIVREAARLPFSPLDPALDEGLSYICLTGEIRHDVADGVVSCRAGTSLAELNAELAKHERWIPFAKVWPEAVDDLATLILLGLPHSEEARYGTWRDWLLGATMVTAEGEIVKSGARVVKSVAGYDAHKLLVGSRGALLLPAEIVLRTFPRPAETPRPPVLVEAPRSILRVLPADAPACRAALGSDVLFEDEATGTFWTRRMVKDLPHFEGGWSMDILHPAVPDALRALHRRTKAVLDPQGKLAPGAFANL